MYSFLNPNGNKLVVLKVTILVTLLGHVVILGYNFVETLKILLTLKVLLTLNISRPPWTRSIVTSVGFLCYYLSSTVEGTKKMILLKLTTLFLWKSSEMFNAQNWFCTYCRRCDQTNWESSGVSQSLIFYSAARSSGSSRWRGMRRLTGMI